MDDRIVIRGAREHNLKNVDLDIPRGAARGHHRPLGLGQVVARLRHHLRRGPAALHGEPERLRAPVSRADGAAGRGPHRRLSPSSRSSRSRRPQSAAHGRNGDRDLRLPAPALRAGVGRLLVQERHADAAPERRRDHRRARGLPRGHARRRARARRARPQGPLPRPLRAGRAQGFERVRTTARCARSRPACSSTATRPTTSRSSWTASSCATASARASPTPSRSRSGWAAGRLSRTSPRSGRARRRGPRSSSATVSSRATSRLPRTA